MLLREEIYNAWRAKKLLSLKSFVSGGMCNTTPGITICNLGRQRQLDSAATLSSPCIDIGSCISYLVTHPTRA